MRVIMEVLTQAREIKDEGEEENELKIIKQVWEKSLKTLIWKYLKTKIVMRCISGVNFINI